MAKTKSVFFCTECGNETPKWAGRCPSCGAWNTLVEQAVGDGAKAKAGGRSRALRAKAQSVSRRTSNGFDYNRAAMLMAVLEKRGALKVSGCDAFLNVIGGLSVDEPAADLAAVLALASSYLDKPIGNHVAAIGEVGLTGELRSVNHLSERLSEVHRLGFETCIIPKQRKDQIRAPQGLALIEARNIAEAMRAIVQA